MCADSIDFANSRADSYAASNSSVMDELNAYFKSYIAGQVGSNDMTLDEAADEIFHGAGFDDAMDMINHEQHPSSSSSSSSSSSDNEDGGRFNGFDDTIGAEPEQNLLDVEILDQHIDKAGITGGADATRAIENMAGGGRTDVLDPIDEGGEEDNGMSEFANAMLGGGSSKKPSYDTSGPVRGYSGVTSEIRVKGNRVTERNRNGSNYLTEDGYVDMSMLGGGSDDEHDQNGHEDDGYERKGDNEANETPIEQGPAEEETEALDIEEEDDNERRANITRNGSTDESSDDSDSEETDDQPGNQYSSSMASEIDHVLSQLRNKTARTLTGGTVNIRKKVVLTDMYPYIIRT